MSDLVQRLRSVDVSWSETGEWCAEAADRIEALQADLAAAEQRGYMRGLEEAAGVADGYHERALEWAKTVRGLTEHIDQTDSSRIARTIRALKEQENDT